MASISLPTDDGDAARYRFRIPKLWLLLIAVVAVAATIYWCARQEWFKRLTAGMMSATVDVEPVGAEVGKQAMAFGTPDDPAKVAYVPKGKASHAVYPVFFGTDRLKTAEWAGVSVKTMAMLAIAWAMAMIAALIFWPRVTWGWLRALAGLGWLASAAIGVWLVLGILPIRFNPAAGRVFGSGRGHLQLGVCAVSIPLDHEEGRVESPSLLRFEFREDPSKHIVLLRVESQELGDFRKELQAMADQVTRREALVVIHGYSNSFEDAARRAAQFCHDIGFQGIPAFYSWPSEGAFEAYTWDAQSVRNTVPHLKAFLETLAKEGNLSAIHVVAHSMGNRCATDAIRRGLDLGGCSLDRCILAAPDVDRDEFEKDWGKDVIAKVKQLTLYASGNDKALLASNAANKFSRLGDARSGVSVMEGMDSIDVTSLQADFMGHAYFGDRTELIKDLRQLIHYRKAVAQRKGLEPVVVTPLKRYWRFQASP